MRVGRSKVGGVEKGLVAESVERRGGGWRVHLFDGGVWNRRDRRGRRWKRKCTEILSPLMWKLQRSKPERCIRICNTSPIFTLPSAAWIKIPQQLRNWKSG